MAGLWPSPSRLRALVRRRRSCRQEHRSRPALRLQRSRGRRPASPAPASETNAGIRARRVGASAAKTTEQRMGASAAKTTSARFGMQPCQVRCSCVPNPPMSGECPDVSTREVRDDLRSEAALYPTQLRPFCQKPIPGSCPPRDSTRKVQTSVAAAQLFAWADVRFAGGTVHSNGAGEDWARRTEAGHEGRRCSAPRVRADLSRCGLKGFTCMSSSSRMSFIAVSPSSTSRRMTPSRVVNEVRARV